MIRRRDAAIAELVRQGLLDEDHPVIGLLDTAALKDQISALNEAFSAIPTVTHTIAAKAVTLVPILEFLAQNGLGCEVASPGEFAMSQAAGFRPEHIVIDSPAKTRSEIRQGLDIGASLNIDSYQEMARFDEEVAARLGAATETDAAAARMDASARGTNGVAGLASIIGVRVNPVVGSGSIGEMSTATTTTKFGIPVLDSGTWEELVQACVQRPWITQLHVHSGSQGIPLSLAAAGIRKVVDLAEAINSAAGYQQITRLDIGGGLSVNFTSDEITPRFREYADVLAAEVPELFSGKYAVVTEFGRSLLAKAGCIATRIEYTKDVGERRFVIGHAGAQTATRTVFMPESWPLRVSAYTAEGHPSTAETRAQDVAGPCCFTGDMIGRDIPLPEMSPGDIAVIPDTGAYYFSTHFTYNALPRIPVYAYSVSAEAQVEFQCIRPQQSVDELLAEAGAGNHIV